MTLKDKSQAEVAKPVARRVSGILAGKITIQDDFDAPLPPEIGLAFGITNEANRPKRKGKK